MNVLYSLTCERASARDDGRVDVAGVFHQLFAPGFPAQQDHLVLALAIEWDQGEEGRREFRIDLMDPNGSPALTIRGHTDVSKAKPGEAPPQTRLLMPMENVVFPVAGSYRFQLEASGNTVALSPIHLIENPDAR